MEVRTKPAMCKTMLRSVLVGAFSVGLAISAVSAFDLHREPGATAIQESGTNAAPPDIIWASATGDIIWASGKGDIIWGAPPADGAEPVGDVTA